MAGKQNTTEDEKLMVQRMGRNIKRLRLDAQLTQDELGVLCGVSGSYLSQLETGGSVDSPGLLVVNSLASVFGVSIDTLILDETSVCPYCNGSGWVTARAGALRK